MYVTPVQVDDALHRPDQKSLNPVVVFSDDAEGRGQVFQRPATGSPPQINDRQRSAADVRHAADNGIELGQQRQSRALQYFLDLEHIDAIQLPPVQAKQQQDRKSTRLNSSHVRSSYAVFCLKKKRPPLSRI